MHRQAIFESKGDKLCSSAECGIRTQDLRHQIANRLNARWLNYRGSSKNLNSTARPYDQRAFSPLDPTAGWLSHLALAIYMVAVVNFDALARARGFRIERRQVVYLCWMQDSNPRSQTPNRQQTECPLTNRLSYRESSKNLNSTARPCDRRTHVTYKIVAMLPVRRREINLITSSKIFSSFTIVQYKEIHLKVRSHYVRLRVRLRVRISLRVRTTVTF